MNFFQPKQWVFLFIRAVLLIGTVSAQKVPCSKRGGGVVVFEPGIYLTGSIFLKEGVELRIDKGVELKGSQHFEDYPEIDTRIAGIEMKWPAALLNIIGVKNAAITVDGIIVCNNEDGHGPSTDGVDIDCNDDDFCLKSGRDWDGLRVNRPTEYVVIRNCTARKGGGLLTIGSETSGGIRHVLATDLTAKGTGNGFHIKSATTRGGTVEDIHVRNITMDSVGNAGGL
jgi:polygalacturonase